MLGLNEIFNIIILCSFIHITQVDCWLDDAIDPVELDFEEWHQRDSRLAIPLINQPNCERRNIYVCEEPPDIVPPDVRKACNYRNVRYHEQVFRWVAGRGCLLFTPDFLYEGGFNPINLTAGCFYGNWYAPCVELPKEDGSCGCYPFDPGLAEVARIVNDALIPSAQGRWARCFYAARDCCSHFMGDSGNNTDSGQCEATFDGWTCWQAAEADTTPTEICSEFVYSNSGPSCHHFSSKECFANATWALQTDYRSCSVTPRLLRRYRFHISMLAFSIASCLPAIFIFFFYKRLRITRVALHRNLLIAIICRNILVIISRNEIYISELTSTGDTVMSTNGLACRVLAVTERVAANAVFIAMLVEGIYLHRLIVAVFRQKLNIKWLYGSGAALATAPVIAWAAVMAVHNNHSCWLVYTIDHVQWILDAPRITILVVNTVLFIDVLRVLFTKIRNSENANQLSTTKATLFLMPLFGTQFLLTAFRPNTINCTGEQIYYYVAYTVEGLQGFIVALLYCYINKEVHVLIKATYKKTENAVVSRIRRDSNYPPTSSDPNSRRITYSTGLHSTNEETAKEHYATIKPKLHVAEIISIQASERLAEILDPVYETIRNDINNGTYDSLERSDIDNDSAIIPHRNYKNEDYYNFTNASSISIECQDWIRCVSSPSSSVYNNSLNDYETKYLERRFPNHPKLQEIKEAQGKSYDQNNTINNDFKNNPDEIINTVEVNDSENEVDEKDDIKYKYNEDMLNEIMQYIATNDVDVHHLDPDLLCPNRGNKDKIVFVDE
ncbi:calcitonin receptor-like protein 1 [Manduca sexta]|uniref:calcitonin receptor-like protein 1 n=1 Tax=Manduca sexta TaxID=7130 RepID=UPI00188E3AE2|nr:calcitonin receptor-like protein 1 [Manduca sexta]